MRPLPLALVALALAIAACGPDAPPAPSADVGVRFDTLRIDEPRRAFTVAIAYPQFENGGALNAAIRDTVAAFADAFRPAEPPPAFESAPIAVEVRGGPEGVLLDDGVFSTLVAATVTTDGTGATRFTLPITYDTAVAGPLAPRTWFRDDAAWGEALAAYAEDAAVDRSGRSRVLVAGLDPIRAGEGAVTLGPDSLYLHVPPFQLSPDPDPLRVAVPYAAVADLARPGGPVARLAARAAAR